MDTRIARRRRITAAGLALVAAGAWHVGGAPTPAGTAHANTVNTATHGAVSADARGPVVARATARGPAATSATPTGKVIHLTFDDGPDPTWTPQALDVLRKYGATGTFFMLGQNAAAHPELVTRVRAAGHRVANHSWNHPQLTRLSADAIDRQLGRTDDVLGPGITCMRPPYGATDARVASAAANRGHKQVLWTIDTQDWRRSGSGGVAEQITANARSGSIVLMHDGGGDRSQTIAGLDRAMGRLASEGYRFEAVPGC